jgi:hypothetical protein
MAPALAVSMLDEGPSSATGGAGADGHRDGGAVMLATSAMRGGEHCGHSGVRTPATAAGPRPGPGPSGAPPRAPRATRAAGAARVAGLILAAAAAVAAACAPPGDRTAGRGPVLYVANGPDGTVTRLDGATGRVVGPPLPAGPTPSELTVGAGGRLLLTSVGAEHQGTLTHVGPERGAWRARTVARALGVDEPGEAAGLGCGRRPVPTILSAARSTSGHYRLTAHGGGALAVSPRRAHREVGWWGARAPRPAGRGGARIRPHTMEGIPWPTPANAPCSPTSTAPPRRTWRRRS